MRTLQYRHRPRRNIQESTGTISSARNCVPQCGQELLPPTLRSPKRRMTTLRKLPTIRPKSPKKTAIMCLRLYAVHPIFIKLITIGARAVERYRLRGGVWVKTRVGRFELRSEDIVYTC